MIQVDFIQMDDYPADNCAISPAAFLLANKGQSAQHYGMYFFQSLAKVPPASS